MKKTFLFLLLFISFFSSACAGLKQSSIPKEWQQLPHPPEIVLSDPNKGMLKITLLNVGQGDSTLITTPNGKTILIDAGNNGKGSEVILPYLQSHQIHSLDLIVTTHYDADHMAGIEEVIAGADGKKGTDDDFIPLQGVYDRGGTPLDSSPFYTDYVKAVEKYRFSLSPGETIAIDTNFSIRCVAVNGSIWNGPSIDLFQVGFHETENSAAIALLVEFKNFRYLTAADLTGGGAPGGFKTLDLETPLADQVGQLTAVHVNHHGSASSSNEKFVNILKPKIALINVGDGNDYHHPAQEVLERWNKVGAKIWLTEKGTGGFISSEKVSNGPIEIITDGTLISVNGERIE